MPTDIDATVFDDEALIDVDGLLISHPEDGVVSGTGGYTPFLRQNNNDGTTTGFNTDDADATKNNNPAGLDMDASWTQSLLLGDLPIVYINGVAYFEIRLDLNEPDNNTTIQQLGLTELQIYTSDGDTIGQATLADYQTATASTRAFDDEDGFNLVYDLDANGDKTIILIDGPSGSGNDDYSFYVPVSSFGDYDPTDNFTLYAQFGPNPPEDATFEEFRIQNVSKVEGIKFNDVDSDGVQDAGEGALEGFVMYIDTNGNNLLDLGEATATSGADGSFTFYSLIAGTYVIREVLSEADLSAAIKADPGYNPDDYLPPDGFWTLTTGTGGDHIIIVEDPGTYELQVGNHELDPSVDLTKSASVDGDCADTVGELVNYTIGVFNDGDTDLTNVVVTDDFADLGSIEEVDEDNDTFNDGDTNEDGKLNPGETWQYTAYHTVTQADIDNNGNYDSSDPPDGINDVLRNVATVNADSEQTDSTVTDSDDATVEVCQDPKLGIEKSATVDGDCVDTVGEKVNYTILVTNEGNVGLENVVVTDDMADLGSLDGDADNDGFIDGDTDEDGVLDLTETWTYTAYHTVTQEDIDNNGNYDSSDPPDGINDVLRNVATANATALTTGEAAEEVTDDATVEVCQDPAIDLTKFVNVDPSSVPPDASDLNWDDANAALGPENVNLGTDVWFMVTVENTGNVTLTDVDIVDNNQTGGLPGTFFDLVVDGELTADAINNHGATLDGDTDGDHQLDTDETWTIIYRQAFDPGNHVNEATVTADATTTGTNVTDSDLAHYYSLVDQGLCPRTPGFWQNPKNGGQFWDGEADNEKHLGQDGFPVGELLYDVDSDGDGTVNVGVKGLLIGDYDHDGTSKGEDGLLGTADDEDVIFVSYADARTLINASNKQLNGSSGDGRFMLGRDMVASWLNYLQGSGFGEASDTESPHHYLDDAIDWMQIFSGTNGGTDETYDILKIAGGSIKTSSGTWQDVQSGFDHSAAQMHSALDYYNNTGQTEPGGTHYANCEDQHLFEALSIYQQAHPELV